MERARAVAGWIIALTLTVLVLGQLPAAADVPIQTANIRIEQRGPNGEPAMGGCWMAYWLDGLNGNERWGHFCDSQDPDGTDGTVVARDLPAGRFRLEPSIAPTGYKLATSNLSATVEDGETVTVHSLHQPLPVLTIRTVDAGGTPLVGSCWMIKVFEEDEGGITLCDKADGADDGAAHIGTLEPGDFFLLHQVAPKGFARIDNQPFTITDADQTLTYTLAAIAPPVNTALPTITGGPAVGSVLNGDKGTWTGTDLRFGLRWQRCNSAGASCVEVAIATPSYTIAAADAGATLRFMVTAVNDGGTVSAYSALLPVLDLAMPVNTTPPTITGAVGITQRLTVDPGQWTNGPSFSYQWQRCTQAGACSDIANAKGASYVPSTADADHRIRAVVTGTNAVGASSATTQPTSVLSDDPFANQRPSIVGTAQVGEVLEAFPGHWISYYGNLNFVYTWMRCVDTNESSCSPAGFVGDYYTVREADEGFRLRVVVTGTDAGGTGTSTSNPTLTVPVLRPINLNPPVVRGTIRVGQELTGNVGIWSGVTKFSWRWLRCDADGNGCVTINKGYKNDQRDALYTLTRDDVGHTLRVAVTGTNSYGSRTVNSEPTELVRLYLPVNINAPVVNGVVRIGSELSANVGVWNDVTRFFFRWQRCDVTGDNCVLIQRDYKDNITDGRLTVSPYDLGHTYRALILAQNNDGISSAVSAPTEVVSYHPPINNTAPSVLGTVRLGQQLTGHVGTWTEAKRFQWRWQRCDANGSGCVQIGLPYKDNLFDSQYTVSRDDVGHTLRVAVTAINGDGTTTAVSAPTAVVQLYPPVNISAPTVNGTVRVGQELSGNVGVWTGATRFFFRWQRCDGAGNACVLIDRDYRDNIFDGHYTVSSADVGHTLRLLIMATNTDGTTFVTSAPTALVQLHPPVNLSVPTVSGVVAVGRTISSNIGQWDPGNGQVRFFFRWQRCDGSGNACVLIDKSYKDNIFDANHVVTTADRGRTLRALIIAVNTDGITWAVSAPTVVVP